MIQLPRSMGFNTADDVVSFHGNGVEDHVHEFIIFIHVELQWVKGGVCTWVVSLVHYI